MTFNKACNTEYKKKAVTVNHVAKQAGVSAGTVTRYLGGISVSKQSRLKIMNAIVETGYRPTHHSNMSRFYKRKS